METIYGPILPGRGPPLGTMSAGIITLTLPDDTTLIATKETLTSVPGSRLREMFEGEDPDVVDALPRVKGNVFVDANPRLFRLLYDRLRVPAIGWETPVGVDPREWAAEVHRWRVGPSHHRRCRRQGVKRKRQERDSVDGDNGDNGARHDDDKDDGDSGGEDDDDAKGGELEHDSRKDVEQRAVGPHPIAQRSLLARCKKAVRWWRDWVEGSPTYEEMLREGLASMEMEFLEHQTVVVGGNEYPAGKWWHNMASHPATAQILKRGLGCAAVVTKWNRPGTKGPAKDKMVDTRWPASSIEKQRLRSEVGTFLVTINYC
jgi:hypothetical protein